MLTPSLFEAAFTGKTVPDISPLAIVEEGAKLADDVRVGPFSYIGPEAVLAAGCVIDNSVTIAGKTSLGENTHVFPMAVIGVASRGRSDTGRCVIGEANTIREHATIYCGKGQTTRIGNGNLIMIGCIIGSGANVADHGIFDNCSHIGPGARIGNYVRMSGFATVCPDKSVGDYAFVTGYSNVDSDAPPYSRVQGSPIRVRGVNTTNLKRCGFGDEDIRSIKSAFRELFNGSDDKMDRKVAGKLLDDPNPYVRRLGEALQGAPAGRGGK